jgi:hypothetical protein
VSSSSSSYLPSLLMEYGLTVSIDIVYNVIKA